MNPVKNILGKKSKRNSCKKCGTSGTLLQSSKGGFMCPDCVVYAGYRVHGDNYVYEED